VTTQGPPPHGRIAHLARRGVVAVEGPDAEKFLNDLVTADVTGTGNGRAVYAGLLTPQGKVLFDFIVFREGNAFLIDVARERAAHFTERLGFYRLRTKATVAERPDLRVFAGWDAAPPVAGTFAADPRLPALGWRLLAADAATNATEADYDAHRIALGVPEGGIDFAFGDVFPHDADMDHLRGVDFGKGCFVGQEVVSRMEHRHIARRRIVSVMAVSALPATGTEIAANGKPIGTLGSSVDGTGLALVRLDRAKDAIDRGDVITAGDVPITLSIPSWATFGWPAPASASET
jgi:folate-binding protein YgfZ